MPDKIHTIPTLPGIKRDGTTFSGKNWTDGQWCRFYGGLPRKMGGYKQIVGGLPNIPRGIYVVNNSPNFNVYIGDESTLKYITIDISGNPISGLIDRTPASLIPSPYNDYTFDTMFSTISNTNKLIVHIAPNLFSIDSTVDGPIFYGDISANTPLVPTGISVSGGICVLHPYLFMFGNDGDVMWSEANDPTTIMGSARITGQKIVAGLQTRGGNSSPAGLLWSLDSVVRVTQVGTTSVEFNFDTVSSESSILSSRSIIEYNGVYFWAGIDTFLYYNGVVQELPNSLNRDYFFRNLNYSQQQKVWATKNTQWGEIWWFYPSGTNTECDSAVIYNVREQTWYDSKISRSDGYFNQTFSDPIWADNDVFGNYSVWMHESGTDQNVGGVLTAIDSYCETGDIAWIGFDADGQRQSIDKSGSLYRVEPDFIETGGMTLVVNGREYANSPVVSSQVYNFDSATTKIDLREQRRIMSLRFESNVIGGFYYMGQTLIVFRLGDTRPA
jgi:hypothetical protein